MLRAVHALLAIVLGCFPHRVRIESEPPGAVVRVDGERMGTTPIEYTVVTWPHLRADACFGLEEGFQCSRRPYRVVVKLPGYRPVTTEIGGDARWWRHALRPFRAGYWDCAMPPFQWKDGECVTPHTVRNILLTEDHGPAGTWTPEEAQE